MFNLNKSLACLGLICGFSSMSAAQETIAIIEEVLVTGGINEARLLSGSAKLINEEALEQFDNIDLSQVLTQAPGVYIRQEDGYGLRPNIGIRGATSERSQKITLMEDGILIAPAPYTAPAAYYIPNVSRMQAVEILKGPASIKHGPHTVGGAINFASRQITDDLTELDLSYGSDNFRKLQLFHGEQLDAMAYWVDLLHYGADGFKKLDGGGDTGFERNDINAKLQFKLGDTIPQLLTIKAGYADEESDETYLGLSDEDFQQNPYRRYRASQLDLFKSEHTHLHASYIAELSEQFTINIKSYYNQFDRSWNKFDGFIGAFDDCLNDNLADGINCLPANAALSSAGTFSRESEIIKGERNSISGDVNDLIDVTDNNRLYGSYGIDIEAVFDLSVDDVEHILTTGMRYHHDYVEREHTTTGYEMQNGLLTNPQDFGFKLNNEASSDAIALFAQHKVTWEKLSITSGIRVESIDGETENLQSNEKNDNSQSIILPGIGLYWQWHESLALLAGINKGFSPAGPGAGDSAEPEESINYEYGFRFTNADFSADIIGFFSDYSNLLGRCRVSDVGCSTGEEFNGGSVEVSGIEVNTSYQASITESLHLPISLTYTYTQSAFQESFTSNFSQWGAVNQGESLPYLPENILRLQAGLQANTWDLLLAIKHADSMREEPGSGNINHGMHTDALTTLDMTASYFWSDALMLQLILENVTDEEKIISHRPFGARPNKPFSSIIRAKYTF